MKKEIRIFADFNNADKKGRIRLNTKGALNDIEENHIVLGNGLKVLLYDDDEISTEGIVVFSEEENLWVAEVKWDSIGSMGTVSD